ncbi:hypothetical protein [Hyphococcus lacteus]|uniref:Exo-alpha-sialidase n=1 Tax=Hyphococcus lacteus TaxID=3143536 RepID=A0ABV3Z8H0_9PROT
MRIVSLVAVLASMVGGWVFTGYLRGGSIDWQSIMANPGGILNPELSDGIVPECTVIAADKEGYNCEVVGNPNANRWPDATAEHAFARSVWDMETAKIGSRSERIYFGGGDWGLNQGPVPIWSLFWQKPEKGEPTLRVAQEQPVFGEAVEFFREVDGRLYVPDIDPKDPWTSGNVYALDEDGWFKYRSLDSAVHVFDVIGFQGALVASTGIVEGDAGLAGLFKSVDNGVTWTRLSVSETEAKKAFRFWRMAELGEGLFVAQSSAREGYWTLNKNWELERYETDLFPDMLDANLRLTVSRAEKFGETVLYSPGLERLPVNPKLLETDLAPVYQSNEHFVAWWEKLCAAWPLMHRNLYSLNKAGEVKVVALPGAPHVNDFTVIEGTVFVLGVSYGNGAYEAVVVSSHDLEEWTELFRVETSAIAISFEQLEGEWILGLGADGMSDVNTSSGEMLRIYSQ